MQFAPPLRHRLATALVAVAAALASAPPAAAGPLVASAPGCDEQVVEQPFLPWADPAYYVLAPDGAAEQTRGWTLRGEAAAADGNESFYVHDADDRSSIALPAGASATSATICVGIEHPTLRFFIRNGGAPDSTLRVEVLFEDSDGSVRSLPIAELLASPGWQPTPPIPVVANLLPLLPGEHTPVAFRFTTIGGGDFRIDDVYVDPWRHR